MFHSITHGNVHDAIALLSDKEVDVNVKNINGQTPLHVIFLKYVTLYNSLLLKLKTEL